MDIETLMQIWRKDLARTGYGQRHDPDPPPSRIHIALAEQGIAISRQSKVWQARIADRLRKRGWLIKEIAFSLGVSASHVHDLLTNTIRQARRA